MGAVKAQGLQQAVSGGVSLEHKHASVFAFAFAFAIYDATGHVLSRYRYMSRTSTCSTLMKGDHQALRGRVSVSASVSASSD